MSLKTLSQEYDLAVIKSIQQSMKNINNVYQVVVLKFSPADSKARISPEATDFLKQQGFEIIAVNAPSLDIAEDSSENLN